MSVAPPNRRPGRWKRKWGRKHWARFKRSKRMKWGHVLTLAAAVLLPGAMRAAGPKVADLLEKKTFTDAASKTLLYRLMKPENYDPKKKYPLVVFLHGAGERGKDNTAQLIHGVPEFAKEENRKKYPCFLIAPQCPKGDKWSVVDWRVPTVKFAKEPSGPGRLVLELITAMQKEYSIDSKRIYLTGLSMGGYGT